MAESRAMVWASGAQEVVHVSCQFWCPGLACTNPSCTFLPTSQCSSAPCLMDALDLLVMSMNPLQIMFSNALDKMHRIINNSFILKYSSSPDSTDARL